MTDVDAAVTVPPGDTELASVAFQAARAVGIGRALEAGRASTR